MAEHCDDWSAAGRPNLWGKVPDVVEMQSEAGAAGALHGALQKGALATTFTASQGLLLMVPNMFKIAGELTPAVIHVAARTIATHALSIFGDHSDVMHARTTGWAMLAAGSVQEAHDFALVAHAATLRARVPFLHFFDGFRTSHEIDRIALLDDDDIRALVREDDVLAFRRPRPDARRARRARDGPEPRRLLPGPRGVQPVPPGRARDRPGGDGRAGRPDRPAVRAGRLPRRARRRAGDRRDGLGDRRHRGDGRRARRPPASGSGMLRIRLFQPFPAEQIIAALPPTVRSIAVLDRTKEPGAVGEPLYLEVVAGLAEAMDSDEPPFATAPRVIGGRYGLSSKEMTPSMIKPIFDELGATAPEAPLHRRHLRRRDPPQPADRRRVPAPPAGRRGPGGVLRARLGRHGRRQQGVGQDHRREHRPVRPGLLRLRLEEVGLDHRLAPALRAGADPLDLPRSRSADFVACHQFGLLGQDQGPRVRQARGDVPAQRPVRPGRGLGPPAGRRPAAADRQGDRLLGDRRPGGRRRGRHGQPDQHGDAAVLLPARRDPARRTRRSPGSRRSSRRRTPSAATRSSQRNFAAIDRSLERLAQVPLGRVTNDRPGEPAGARGRARLRRRASPPACWPARATCCRSAPCRSTARSRPGRRSTRSGRSPR